MSKEYDATLVNGRVYIYEGQHFQRGKAVRVTEEVKEHLEENAVLTTYSKAGDDRLEHHTSRFTFVEADGKAESKKDGKKSRPARV